MWRLYIPAKHHALSELHGVTIYKTALFMVTAVRKSNITG
jgi:hypothetical protein